MFYLYYHPHPPFAKGIVEFGVHQTLFDRKPLPAMIRHIEPGCMVSWINTYFDVMKNPVFWIFFGLYPLGIEMAIAQSLREIGMADHGDAIEILWIACSTDGSDVLVGYRFKSKTFDDPFDPLVILSIGVGVGCGEKAQIFFEKFDPFLGIRSYLFVA